MKNVLRLSIYALLWGLGSCADHPVPPPISCAEFTSRITSCISWRLTSRTVNKVEAIKPCALNQRLVFPGGNFGQAFLFVGGSDPEFCDNGLGANSSGGSYSCSNGTITLTKTVCFLTNTCVGPISQTLNFLSPSTFLISYTDTKGNAVVETYVANCD